MMSQRLKNHHQSIKIFGAIFITLLFISTVTAVPQVNGKPVMDKIQQKEEIEQLTNDLSEQINNPIQEKSSWLLNFLLNLLMNILGKHFDITALTELINSLLSGTAEGSLMEIIQNLLSGILENNNGGDTPSGDNPLLNFLISIFKVLITLIATLFKILINASVGIIGGIIKVISAVFTIILLILVGTQAFFTLGALLMLFLGVMSKIGIKALSVIGAPIFALIAMQFSISMGTVLSGLSTAVFSILSILLLVALPLGLIGLIFILIGGLPDGGDGFNEGFKSNFDFDRTGFFYILLSTVLNKVQ